MGDHYSEIFKAWILITFNVYKCYDSSDVASLRPVYTCFTFKQPKNPSFRGSQREHSPHSSQKESKDLDPLLSTLKLVTWTSFYCPKDGGDYFI